MSWFGKRTKKFAQGGMVVDHAAAELERYVSVANRAIPVRTSPNSPSSEALARAWWEGANAQWKHRPIGNRIPETENPYRSTE